MAKKQELEKVAPEPAAMNRDDVMQMLGAARYAEWIADQSASHVMQFLMTVEQQKLYLATGDASFVEFLERSGLKKKSSYYNHRSLLLNEGPELFDLMEEWKVPARIRQQITAGDIRLDGKDVYIGNEVLDPGSPTIAKQVIEQLVKEKIAATKTAADATEELERKDRRLKAEQQTVDDLRSAIDKFNEKTPFQIAFGDLFAAASILADFVANELDAEDRERRAEQDCKALEVILNDVKEAYGIAKWQTMLHEADKKAAAAGGAK